MERNHDAEIRYLGCNRERRIFVARRPAELPIKLEECRGIRVSRERARQIGARLREGAERRPASGRRDGAAEALAAHRGRFPVSLSSHGFGTRIRSWILTTCLMAPASSRTYLERDWSNAGSAGRHRPALAARTREGEHRCPLCMCSERGAGRAARASPSFAPPVSRMSALPMSSAKGKSYVAGN